MPDQDYTHEQATLDVVEELNLSDEERRAFNHVLDRILLLNIQYGTEFREYREAHNDKGIPFIPLKRIVSTSNLGYSLATMLGREIPDLLRGGDQDEQPTP